MLKTKFWFALSLFRLVAYSEDHDSNLLSVRALNDLNENPPAILYHVGPREGIEEDIRANTIPQTVWDKYVMGSSTRFKLPHYRRGLYGAGDPAEALHFETSLKDPGFMMIRIKKDCLAPEFIYRNKDTFEASESSPFYQWLKKAHHPPFSDFSQIDKECYATHSGKRSFEVSKQYLEDETQCLLLINTYYNELGVKIIRDTTVAGSWYIRDRACIEGIDGPGDAVLQVMRKPFPFWSGTISKRTNVSRMVSILRKSLEASKKIDLVVLNEIEKSLRDTYPPLSDPDDIWEKASRKSWDEMIQLVLKKKSALK